MIAALVAGLMVAPAFAFQQLPVDRSGIILPMGLAATQAGAASFIQGFLLRMTRRERGAPLAGDVRTAVRMLPLLLVLNLLALVIVGGGAAIGALGASIGLPFIRGYGYGLARDITIWAGLIAGVLPGLIFLTRWAVCAPLIVNEGETLVGAMLRSAGLLRGRLWRVALLQVLAPAAITGALLVAFQIKGDTGGAPMGFMFWLMCIGVIFAAQSLLGGRLLRELNALEGSMGAADLAEVFD